MFENFHQGFQTVEIDDDEGTRVNFNKKKIYANNNINTMTPTVWRIMKFAFFI